MNRENEKYRRFKKKRHFKKFLFEIWDGGEEVYETGWINSDGKLDEYMITFGKQKELTALYNNIPQMYNELVSMLEFLENIVYYHNIPDSAKGSILIKTENIYELLNKIEEQYNPEIKPEHNTVGDVKAKNVS